MPDFLSALSSSLQEGEDDIVSRTGSERFDGLIEQIESSLNDPDIDRERLVSPFLFELEQALNHFEDHAEVNDKYPELMEVTLEAMEVAGEALEMLLEDDSDKVRAGIEALENIVPGLFEAKESWTTIRAYEKARTCAKCGAWTLSQTVRHCHECNAVLPRSVEEVEEFFTVDLPAPYRNLQLLTTAVFVENTPVEHWKKSFNVVVKGLRKMQQSLRIVRKKEKDESLGDLESVVENILVFTQHLEESVVARDAVAAERSWKEMIENISELQKATRSNPLLV